MTITTIAAIFVAGLICQWIAWRTKLPAIVYLLFTGILAGPTLGWLDPDKLLGDLLIPFVSLSVAVVLFEGSLTLKYREIATMKKVVRRMVSYGMVITWVITAVATRWALGFSWEVSFLFGAVTVVTGPTVIVPMLRTVRPKASISNILRWESIVIDPIGAALAVIVFQFIVSGGWEHGLVKTMVVFAQILGVGSLLGIIGGYLFGLSIRNHWIPEFLHEVAALSLVCGIFSLANFLQHESGLITVTVMGFIMANMEDVEVDEIFDFKESLSIFLISLLFIILAARLDFAQVARLGWGAGIVFLAIQFLARPLNIVISTSGSELNWPERHMLAWIAPRGIVAAAISALFAIRLEAVGYQEAQLIVPLTFMVIIGTVLLQSATARPIAHFLKVAEPEPRGFLIVGANPVARAIGKALVRHGYRALLADANWDGISKARMEGLDTYFGSPTSTHADRYLDLVGIGNMLALSHHEALNLFSLLHYRMELGRNNVYYLQSKVESAVSENLRISSGGRGHKLFGEEVTYAKLSKILGQGGEVGSTRLTDGYNYENFLAREKEEVIIPLFAISPRERLYIYTTDSFPSPGPGWKVINMSIAKEKMD